MEMYLVHYNYKHGSNYDDAVTHAVAAADPCGLAVIAYKIEVGYLHLIQQNKFSPSLNPLNSSLSRLVLRPTRT